MTVKSTKKELMPGVSLTCVRTEKFKTGCLSVSLLTQLGRESAASVALIPRVLRRGSALYPDMEIIARELDELYGARIEPVVRKKGEIQALGFYADFVDDAFLPGGDRLLPKVANLLGEILLRPCTRGGLLTPAYVQSEREKLVDEIRARINEKRSYSVLRLFELMCFGEDYAVDRLGNEDDAEAITYLKLSRRYKDLLARSPIDIFYCGSADPATVERALADALAGLPRGEIDFDIGTDVRMNSVEEEYRYFEDRMNVTQGKLAIGFRLGDCMEDPDFAALRVFNAVYGGSVTSKLFMNVRERLSLCYFASSGLDTHKGLMYVSSGIEFDKFNEARDEIFAQLEAVRQGDITDEELEAARKYVASSLRAAMDSPAMLEEYYLNQNILGQAGEPDELAVLCESVTKDEVVEIARGVQCDAVYFLRGGGEV